MVTILRALPREHCSAGAVLGAEALSFLPIYGPGRASSVTVTARDKSLRPPVENRQEATHAETQHELCCEREAALRRALAEREAEVEHLTDIAARGDGTVRGALSRLKVSRQLYL